jgi:hypothetical protein
MLESGKYPSLRALAEHEGIDNSYVRDLKSVVEGRVLR